MKLPTYRHLTRKYHQIWDFTLSSFPPPPALTTLPLGFELKSASRFGISEPNYVYFGIKIESIANFGFLPFFILTIPGTLSGFKVNFVPNSEAEGQIANIFDALLKNIDNFGF